MMTGKRDHILIVDDDAMNRELLSEAVQQQGCVVTLAEDGQQAWSLLRTQPFDLVLLDILMPYMNGYEVLERMRKDGLLRAIPVIVISALDDIDSIVKCIEMGAEDYLTRPFNLVFLRARVQAALEKKRLRDQEQAFLQELQQRNYALGVLTLLGQQISAMLDMQQITSQLPRAITEVMGVEGASLWLWDEARPGWLVCRAVFHPGLAPSALLGRPLRPGEGIAGWVAQNGQSVIVDDVSEDARFFAGVDEATGFHTRSLLAVPLKVHYAVIGVLEVVNKQSGNFDAEDLSLVEMLAMSAAIAIDNAVLFEARRQLSEELKARNQELDAFAHTVAHDLKGALTNIIGFASVVRDSYFKMSDDQLRRCLQMVVSSGQRMSGIVDELLLLASMRKMTMVEMKPLDMASIVAQARDRLLFMLEESQAQLQTPETWPAALGYAPWIEEVWANYISNAIKYGGEQPRIELGATPQDDGMVRFWVRDHGPGIAPEHQVRLFALFERLDQAKIGGHGLGLSIVKHIMEKLGGQVGIESQLGEGSTFSFTLPSPELAQSILIDKTQGRAITPGAFQ